RIILQPDGKIVAAREPVEFVNTYTLVRFKPDGATDTGFQSVANNTVNCLGLQSDGKILVGGAFTTLGGVSRTVLGRLNTNGPPDTGFHPTLPGAPSQFTQPPLEVFSVAVRPDGKIL